MPSHNLLTQKLTFLAALTSVSLHQIVYLPFLSTCIPELEKLNSTQLGAHKSTLFVHCHDRFSNLSTSPSLWFTQLGPHCFVWLKLLHHHILLHSPFCCSIHSRKLCSDSSPPHRSSFCTPSGKTRNYCIQRPCGLCH